VPLGKALQTFKWDCLYPATCDW